ncbi:MAG: hypothetical protein A2W93_03600 [Bacteroidetes bacterium GWF2_43_63]|nr:MAG: hypothetical protein A2W93_03600 [Bacteroidetes bacterium GWF2_43_63]HBG70512.1 hypothetical protein [Bacteroidales bacterium]HCB61507.1 hypothetical protein [Bacteroidales bacterium]
MIFFGFWRDVKCTHLTNASTFDAEHHHVPRPPRSTTLASLLFPAWERKFTDNFYSTRFFVPLLAKAIIEYFRGKNENAHEVDVIVMAKLPAMGGLKDSKCLLYNHQTQLRNKSNKLNLLG